MTPEEEIARLHRRLEQLACEADVDPVLKRYPRLYGRLRLGAYRRARLAAGDVLRRLRLKTPPLRQPWLVGLRHASGTERAQALVIWARGMDRDPLRAACLGFKRIENALLPRFAPVLVTDVADFAFFSRLGWLVEYVPQLSPPATGYALRKTRYLAWRYRDAPTLPSSVGLMPGLTGERVIELIDTGAREAARAER